MLLLVFESLGTTELLVILVVALVLFGPRKLPELGRMLGKSLAEFKRQTDDFKRTWEREVELDKLTREVRIDDEVREAREALDADYTPPALEANGDGGAVATTVEGAAPPYEAQTIARGARADDGADAVTVTAAQHAESIPAAAARGLTATADDSYAFAGETRAAEEAGAAAGEASPAAADEGAVSRR
ncbi:MAG TPA: twin-arginine translocase TatA/TatE family subunit [Pyrinomonadaceae bacterium]|nr:twin-arginine translocase TatA/TatE family subunit [Pyrinomonadaceae bacterium]